MREAYCDGCERPRAIDAGLCVGCGVRVAAPRGRGSGRVIGKRGAVSARAAPPPVPSARPLDEGEAWCDRCDGVRALDLNGHCMDCGAKVSGVLHERPVREEWTEPDDGSLVREPQRESARGRVTWEAPCARCGEETLHTATGGCALCAERRENRLHGLLYLVFGVLGLFLFRWPGPALRRGLRAVIAGTDPEAD